MGHEHPPTIPSQLMDYGSLEPASTRGAATGAPVWKLLLRVLLVALAGFVVYKLVRG